MTQIADRVCERCGAAATVSVVTVAPNRGGVRPTPKEHQYCLACARTAGVPLRTSRDPEDYSPEPEPPSWSDLERHLAQYAETLEEEPGLRDHVMSLAQLLLRASKQLDGPMPASVAAGFARIGIGPSTDSTAG
jgi:hypothetical protein